MWHKLTNTVGTPIRITVNQLVILLVMIYFVAGVRWSFWAHNSNSRSRRRGVHDCTLCCRRRVNEERDLIWNWGRGCVWCVNHGAVMMQKKRCDCWRPASRQDTAWTWNIQVVVPPDTEASQRITSYLNITPAYDVKASYWAPDG